MWYCLLEKPTDPNKRIFLLNLLNFNFLIFLFLAKNILIIFYSCNYYNFRPTRVKKSKFIKIDLLKKK
jgi:hypothetical protein